MCFEGLRKTRKTSVMIAVFRDENKKKNTVSVRETRKHGNKTAVMIAVFPDENKEKNTVSVRETRKNVFESSWPIFWLQNYFGCSHPSSLTKIGE